jgi:hypothetical protein
MLLSFSIWLIVVLSCDFFTQLLVSMTYDNNGYGAAVSCHSVLLYAHLFAARSFIASSDPVELLKATAAAAATTACATSSGVLELLISCYMVSTMGTVLVLTLPLARLLEFAATAARASTAAL